MLDGLDVSALEKAYAGRGSTAYHPPVLLSLLVYGYANEVFSSLDARLPYVEFEAHGRIASAVAENSGNRAYSSKIYRNLLVKTEFHHPGQLKSDRLPGMLVSGKLASASPR